MLRACGCEESQLACGPHPPLSPAVAEEVARTGVKLTPKWSNCSGKHSGMLALARHHGWPTEGYERAGHPVQERILAEVRRWTGRGSGSAAPGRGWLHGGVLRPAAERHGHGVRAAWAPRRRRRRGGCARRCWAHPELVAGTGRLCTELMTACRGTVLAKVGAEGVYCAALPALGLGVALKVEDGDGRCSPPALLAVLRQVAASWARGRADAAGGGARAPRGAGAPQHAWRSHRLAASGGRAAFPLKSVGGKAVAIDQHRQTRKRKPGTGTTVARFEMARANQERCWPRAR